MHSEKGSYGMRKKVTVKSHTRKTKSGKVAVVKSHMKDCSASELKRKLADKSISAEKREMLKDKLKMKLAKPDYDEEGSDKKKVIDHLKTRSGKTVTTKKGKSVTGVAPDTHGGQKRRNALGREPQDPEMNARRKKTRAMFKAFRAKKGMKR